MKSRTIVFTEAYQAEILEKEVPKLAGETFCGRVLPHTLRLQKNF